LRITPDGDGRIAIAQQEPSASAETASRALVAHSAKELFEIVTIPSIIRSAAVVRVRRTLAQGRQRNQHQTCCDQKSLFHVDPPF